MLQSVVDQVNAGMKAGLDLEALKAQVKFAVPPASLYATASQRALDALFRMPAIESLFKEKD